MRPVEQQDRIDRVQNAVNKIKQLPGVADAIIDDFNMDATGFNVDVTYKVYAPLDARKGVPYNFEVNNLRKIVPMVNAVLRMNGCRSRSIQQPKRVYNYLKDFKGYDRKWGRFDVYTYN